MYNSYTIMFQSYLYEKKTNILGGNLLIASLFLVTIDAC